jgi:hypothetical protein
MFTAGTIPSGIYGYQHGPPTAAAEVLVEVDRGMPALTDSQQVACSPDAICSIFGKWLASQDWTTSEPSGYALRLGGTQVRINGEPVPILSSSPAKVSFLCPKLNPGTPLVRWLIPMLEAPGL